ncbi:MAG: hypothetical protein ACRDTH_19785 [Pseudonocardiaceae bacterium]
MIPSSTVEPVPLARKLIEQPVPDTTGDYKPPATVIDLIYRVWISLEWAKTGQMVVILLVAGLTVALVFAGMGLLVHALIGTSAAWSAVGVCGIVAGGGAAVYVRRRQRHAEFEQPRP